MGKSRPLVPLALVCLLLVTAILFSGCMSMSAGIAPSTTPLAGKTYTEIGSASGSSWGWFILNILPVSEVATHKAVNRALRASGGDALINVTVDNIQYMIPFIGTITRSRVLGTAVTVR